MNWKTLLAGCGALFVSLVLTILWLVFDYLHSPISSQTQDQMLIIKSGSSFAKVEQQLVELGLLEKPEELRLLAEWQGAIYRIQSGEYLISPKWTPVELLGRLTSGQTMLHSVTLPEGKRFIEVVDILQKKGFGQKEDFLVLFEDEALLKQIEVSPTPANLEGFLFPETYLFSKSLSPRKIFGAMIRQFNQNYVPLKPQARRIGWSDQSVITLASIIEKETGLSKDRPLISAVFHNRLKRRMRLQSDPTVIYGIVNFDGNLTRQHLRTKTPFNTYTHRGLPPHPIANPGQESIQSALQPADVNYLYFVARGDGSSQFSKTLKEHNQAVWKYQKKRSKP